MGSAVQRCRAWIMGEKERQGIRTVLLLRFTLSKNTYGIPRCRGETWVPTRLVSSPRVDGEGHGVQSGGTMLPAIGPLHISRVLAGGSAQWIEPAEESGGFPKGSLSGIGDTESRDVAVRRTNGGGRGARAQRGRDCVSAPVIGYRPDMDSGVMQRIDTGHYWR